jgi:hypothetical protein
MYAHTDKLLYTWFLIACDIAIVKIFSIGKRETVVGPYQYSIDGAPATSAE